MARRLRLILPKKNLERGTASSSFSRLTLQLHQILRPLSKPFSNSQYTSFPIERTLKHIVCLSLPHRTLVLVLPCCCLRNRREKTVSTSCSAIQRAVHLWAGVWGLRPLEHVSLRSKGLDFLLAAGSDRYVALITTDGHLVEELVQLLVYAAALVRTGFVSHVLLLGLGTLRGLLTAARRRVLTRS